MLAQAAPNILIVDDDPAHGASVRDLLAAHQHSAVCTTDNHAVLERLAEHDYSVLILDLNMPGVTGVDILETLQRTRHNVKTIVLSGEKSLSTVTPILRLGAYDYLAKPFEPQQLLTSVENALGRSRLEQENMALAQQAQADNLLHQFLINASPDLIYMLDEKGRFSFLNEKIDDLFDVSREDVLGEPWQNLVGFPLSDQLRFRFYERRTGKRATRNYEFDFTAPSGRRRIFEFSASGLYEKRQASETGRHSGTYGVLRDVTEARCTARDLVLSQQ
ncbi:MAG: response regulator, partial [Pseudomonadales bacterium]|nr:response regulator [Pseudomonadales bacterium]